VRQAGAKHERTEQERTEQERTEQERTELVTTGREWTTSRAWRTSGGSPYAERVSLRSRRGVLNRWGGSDPVSGPGAALTALVSHRCHRLDRWSRETGLEQQQEAPQDESIRPW